MSSKPILQLKFDHNLDFQLEAIQSVVELFQGLGRFDSGFQLGDGVISNLPPEEVLAEDWLLNNLLALQKDNQIRPNALLDVDEGLVLEGAGNESWRYPSFTVEMETGTGKTYVYLRTIYELQKYYGFRKFIIVVPSIAIYEGVIKSFEIMESHFRSLYGNERANLIRYDGSKLSTLRSFTASSFIEIMVMTMQSFNTAQGSSNKIYRSSEQLPGERKPYQYIQETRPILILDEPQNMGSELSKEALRTLHPLFALRYSATHREVFNLVSRLTPFDAYQRGLVKRIQVDGVFEQHNLDAKTVILREVRTSPLTAVVQTLAIVQGQAKPALVQLRLGDDLYSKTRHPDHQHGFRVTEITARRNETFVDFNGAPRISADDIFGTSKHTIFRIQIERTIERHMKVQHDLQAKGLKVLSLFFIDRVANYVNADGLIKTLFDEAYEKIKQRYPYFHQWEAAEVRKGYFARSKPVKGESEGNALDTEGRNNTEREAEKEAFRLIMREKERLLSFDEPVSFIFAHSALKEGWDNPNVFQICTLNQTVSEMKKRQEIGRGLRLPVDQNGERLFDETINVLTVVANESYENYAATLQNEYRDAGYEQVPPKVTRADAGRVMRNPQVYENPHFRDFWQKLSKKSRYQIHVHSSLLIDECLKRFNKNENKNKLNPQVVIEVGKFVITRFEFTLMDVRKDLARLSLAKTSTEADFFHEKNERTYQRGDDLVEKHNDKRLRGYRLVEVHEEGDYSYVIFENNVKLMKGETSLFETETGQKATRRAEEVTSSNQPIFNLIDRAAKETGLTRKTINQIFKCVRDDYKDLFLKNPEGFGNLFISTLNESLADHIVQHLEFKFDHGAFEQFELETLFPQEKDFPQKELESAGQAGIYDHVQVDSEIERSFVRNFLSGNDPKVIGYFKFPPAYKVDLPRLIGNYNPDWGILRRDDQNNIVLKLVRETKGREDTSMLRFSNEARKINAAQKHFREIGVDYRVVTDKSLDWYELESAKGIREPRLPYGEEEE
jgi:type III restriction enzyme